jgi:hypothetical protein
VKKIIIALLILFSIFFSGCFKHDNGAMVEWENLIKFNGITYYADFDGYSEDFVDKEYATVKFTLAPNIHYLGYKVKNGDASFINKGEKIYTVKGYKPEFRLAGYVDMAERMFCIFESVENSKAKYGSDIYDLKGKVDFISLSTADHYNSPGVINDADTIDKIVDTMDKSRVIKRPKDLQDKSRLLVFHLKDGTYYKCLYYDNSNILIKYSQGVKLPDEFKILIDELVF